MVNNETISLHDGHRLDSVLVPDSDAVLTIEHCVLSGIDVVLDHLGD
jgi:hypothetical protein